MRDPNFVARHRGGLLSDVDRRLLMKWALARAEHRAFYLTVPIDPSLIEAMQAGR